MNKLYVYFGILLSVADVHCSIWNHIEQGQWPHTCLQGKRQSPINLDPKIAMSKQSFEKFHFSGYKKEQKGSVKNTGHSVELKVDDAPKVWGGGLKKEYTLDHLHFHWQSEHTFKGHRFPLEVHLVHYATEYKSVANALNYGDGLAVLAVFYELSLDDDTEFEPLAKVIEHVESNHNSFQMNEEIVLRSFLPRNVAGFYRYEGSLTTPNCTEAVIWTIFSNTIPISRDQVERFEKIQTDLGKLKVNYRSLQNLGERTLYHRMSPVPHGSSSKHSNNVFLSLITLLIMYGIYN
ncbi:hypothetical protein FQA39_LY15001 [Lamprigera yunnana]|nr:hypothetical protein FQA39_LY15001 [Lamprigera yunnana]